jgi:hypothetical protein
MIFPGAGYLIMVIEAMKQLFQLRNMAGRITNINFQNITISNPGGATTHHQSFSVACGQFLGALPYYLLRFPKRLLD